MSTGSGSAPLFVVGNLPPPVTGQTVATERLATLLADDRDVRRISLSAGDGAGVHHRERLDVGRARHYLGLRSALREALAEEQAAPVLWASISPTPLGHLRDLVTVLPNCVGHPVFGVVHWGNFDRLFRSRLTGRSGRAMLKRLRGLVFLSDELARRCAEWVPARQRHVIPNTVDPVVLCDPADCRVKQAQRAERAADRDLRILFLANMIESKGYLDVLGAVALLAERGFDVRAEFAGGWENDAARRHFQTEVAAHGLERRVVHHGPVDDRTVVRSLHLDADVLVLPTYYPTEAQPYSIIEALNAATPVVTTRHAGIPGMVRQDREALFVPPRDPVAIAEALGRLVDQGRWNELSTAARRRFEEEFSPPAVRRRWLELLDPV